MSWKIAIRLFMSLYLPSLIDVGGVVAIRVVRKSRENTRIWSRCEGEAGRGRELLCNIEVLISRNRGRGLWSGGQNQHLLILIPLLFSFVFAVAIVHFGWWNPGPWSRFISTYMTWANDNELFYVLMREIASKETHLDCTLPWSSWELIGWEKE